MSFLVIATDYDETIASGGQMDAIALDALRRWRSAAGKVILITGRMLEDLRGVLTHWEIFDLVVIENGAALYHPAEKKDTLLCGPPPRELVARLREQEVKPLLAGKCIVATEEPHEPIVARTIQELRLDWHIVRNREAVMAMPKTTDKGSGLAAALSAMGTTAETVFGIGDAENDLAFLKICGLSAAVANAAPVVKQQAAFITREKRGAGVAEAVDHLFALRALPDLIPSRR